jgi:hypothetical protein
MPGEKKTRRYWKEERMLGEIRDTDHPPGSEVPVAVKGC